IYCKTVKQELTLGNEAPFLFPKGCHCDTRMSCDEDIATGYILGRPVPDNKINSHGLLVGDIFAISVLNVSFAELLYVTTSDFVVHAQVVTC
ncbi:MAG: hypothetical protein ACKPKO_49155, partial [Candidatus Fonsibacter sp.]